MISDERLQQIAAFDFYVSMGEAQCIAKELLALRKAFSEPAAYEVKGLLCHTLEEAEIYVGEPEPLYRKP
ncbi:hypothetical protein IFU25_07960 [Pantoea agglomerans]|uniref:hypothetical protein n=1 Tax=Enterobacter agglomerans TaxID=549 RepID=UPI00177D4D09|nr:hypothetical protein [Pantoea agglomerans]MBD8181635.1 hypothetical protein [Pantoea agglomerans]